MKSDFDVVIIGASLAGISAAQVLLQFGHSVCLVDKSTFPRAKPCGEGLSLAGIKVLERLDLFSELRSISPYSFYGFTIHSTTNSRGRVPIHFGTGDCSGMSVPRFDLDARLLDAVLRQADGLLGTRITAISRPALWRIEFGKLSVYSKILIIADGSRSQASQLLSVPANKSPLNRYGARLLLESSGRLDLQSVNILPFGDHELYVSSLSERAINLSILGSKSAIYRTHRSLLQTMQVLESRFENTFKIIESSHGAGPFGGSRAEAPKGAFIIGDAAETLDPLGGLGMTHALQTGEAAGGIAAEVLMGKITEELATKRFSQKRMKIVRPLRGFTRLTQLATSKFSSSACLHLFNGSSISEHMARGLSGESGMFASFLNLVGH